MLEQIIVWIIVAGAALYAVREIARNVRKSGDHCGDCGLRDKDREQDGKR